MDKHILSFDLRALVKAINRYLGETMPEPAHIATGGNARIIMFLNRNRDKDIYQHTIEEKFCISRSTASRVLTLMEKKGLIVRVPVEHDARCKKIMLTSKADDIASDLKANCERVETLLVDGFSDEEKTRLMEYVARMRGNIERAQNEFRAQQDRMSPVEDAMLGALADDGLADGGHAVADPHMNGIPDVGGDEGANMRQKRMKEENK